MRFTTFAALAAATALAQEVSPSSSVAGATASAASSIAVPSSSASPSATGNATTVQPSPAAGGSSTSGSSGTDSGVIGIFANLTPQCRQAAIGILTSGESGKCLNAGKLVGYGSSSGSSASSASPGLPTASPAASAIASDTAFISASAKPASSGLDNSTTYPVPPAPGGSSSSASAIPNIDAFLTASCGAAPCSNATITTIAETVMSACAVDLASAGISNDTVKLIAQLYPVAREAACLKASNPPVYDATKVGPGQEVPGNGTAGTHSSEPATATEAIASSALPSASAAPAVASSSAAGSPSSSPAADPAAPVESSAVPTGGNAKRQEPATDTSDPATSESATAADPAAGSADPAASANSTSPGGMTLPPNATIPVNGTNPGPNGTGAANATANTTFCATALLKEVEEWWGHPLTSSQLLALIYSPVARSKLSRFPAANLCTDCVYAAVSLVKEGAPWLTELPLDSNGTTFDAWYALTCPTANASISTNGTLPQDVSATAEQSTFGFPVTEFNATTGSWETSAPSNITTPIGASNGTVGGNSTEANGTSTAWPWPAATGGAGGNSTAPIPVPVNGTVPDPAADAGASPSPATDFAFSFAFSFAFAGASPSPAAVSGEQAPPVRRRRVRFMREGA